MKILALETSSRRASIAALESGRPVFQSDFPQDRRTSEVFAVQLNRALQHASWSPRDVELVAVSVGPGSFTGLRIGTTAAKTFAYAVGVDVCAVNTLEVIAAQFAPADGLITTVLDAQRDQLFSASFRAQGHVREARGTKIVHRDDWLATRCGGETVGGPGLQQIADRLPDYVKVSDKALWHPKASTVGNLAYAGHGTRVAPLNLKPAYFRKSAAEEKAETISKWAPE